MNSLTKQTWQKMGRLMLVWSLVQLRLSNYDKVKPIRHAWNLIIDVEGMKTYTDFDVIEVFDVGGSYPTLLGIRWANDSMALINFKKRMGTFENQYIRVIAPMDPKQGRIYIE